MIFNLAQCSQGRVEPSTPVGFREKVQAVLRRGDGELTLQPENTLSIFFMIRSAHCTAA